MDVADRYIQDHELAARVALARALLLTRLPLKFQCQAMPCASASDTTSHCHGAGATQYDHNAQETQGLSWPVVFALAARDNLWNSEPHQQGEPHQQKLQPEPSLHLIHQFIASVEQAQTLTFTPGLDILTDCVDVACLANTHAKARLLLCQLVQSQAKAYLGEASGIAHTKFSHALEEGLVDVLVTWLDEDAASAPTHTSDVAYEAALALASLGRLLPQHAAAFLWEAMPRLLQSPSVNVVTVAQTQLASTVTLVMGAGKCLESINTRLPTLSAVLKHADSPWQWASAFRTLMTVIATARGNASKLASCWPSLNVTAREILQHFCKFCSTARRDQVGSLLLADSSSSKVSATASLLAAPFGQLLLSFMSSGDHQLCGLALETMPLFGNTGPVYGSHSWAQVSDELCMLVMQAEIKSPMAQAVCASVLDESGLLSETTSLYAVLQKHSGIDIATLLPTAWDLACRSGASMTKSTESVPTLRMHRLFLHPTLDVFIMDLMLDGRPESQSRRGLEALLAALQSLNEATVQLPSSAGLVARMRQVAEGRRDQSTRVRCVAMKIVAALTWSLDGIEQFLEDGQWEARDTACCLVVELARSSGVKMAKGIVHTCSKLLDDPSPFVRASAAEGIAALVVAIGTSREPEVVSALERLMESLSDADCAVRRAAFGAARALLGAQLQTGDAQDASSRAAAVFRTTLADEDFPLKLDTLSSLCEHNAWTLLLGQQLDAVVDGLVAALEDEDQLVRQRSALFLLACVLSDGGWGASIDVQLADKLKSSHIFVASHRDQELREGLRFAAQFVAVFGELCQPQTLHRLERWLSEHTDWCQSRSVGDHLVSVIAAVCGRHDAVQGLVDECEVVAGKRQAIIDHQDMDCY